MRVAFHHCESAGCVVSCQVTLCHLSVWRMLWTGEDSFGLLGSLETSLGECAQGSKWISQGGGVGKWAGVHFKSAVCFPNQRNWAAVTWETGSALRTVCPSLPSFHCTVLCLPNSSLTLVLKANTVQTDTPEILAYVCQETSVSQVSQPAFYKSPDPGAPHPAHLSTSDTRVFYRASSPTDWHFPPESC